MISEEGTPLNLDSCNYSAFFLSWGRRLKISIALIITYQSKTGTVVINSGPRSTLNTYVSSGGNKKLKLKWLWLELLKTHSSQTSPP